MARRAKAGEDPDALAGSLTDKKAIIAQAVRDMAALKTERKKLGEDMAEVRGRIKSAGILQADFNVAMRLWELEGDERDASLDGLRICFEALAIGGQGDLFPGAAKAEAGDGKGAKPPVQTQVKPAKGAKAKKNGQAGDGKTANLGDFKAQKEAAKEAGRQAFRDGKTVDDCPYSEEPLRVAWVTGLDLEAEETEAGARGKTATVGDEDQPAVH